MIKRLGRARVHYVANTRVPVITSYALCACTYASRQGSRIRLCNLIQADEYERATRIRRNRHNLPDPNPGQSPPIAGCFPTGKLTAISHSYEKKCSEPVLC